MIVKMAKVTNLEKNMMIQIKVINVGKKCDNQENNNDSDD